MKKLRKIDLFRLSKAEMEKREQDAVRGGTKYECACTVQCTCRCGCQYAGPQTSPTDPMYGGSSTADNKNANARANGKDVAGLEAVSLGESYADSSTTPTPIP